MQNEYLTTIEKEMRKGLIVFSVLSAFTEEEVYVSDILNNLKKAQLITSDGTLYPLLSRLTKEGSVTYTWKESTGGPPRKYYKLTDKGKVLLEEYKKLWSKISNSINLLIQK